ncbi:MAG: hypothetical protein HN833_04105 [Elusimicrobiaceae bacterium]|nr:hypothetical protein [Elusimicrobiaceae bacterium]
MADNKIKISKNIPVESYITASILAGALLVGVFTPIERIPVIGGMAESLGMQQAELGRSFASLTAESFSFKQTGNIAKGETTKEVLKTNNPEYFSQMEGFGVLGGFSWRGTESSEGTLYPATKTSANKQQMAELKRDSELTFNTAGQKAYVFQNEKENKIDASRGLASGSGTIGDDAGLNIYANKGDIKNRAMFMDSSIKSSPIFVNLDEKKSGASVAVKKADILIDKEQEGKIIRAVDGGNKSYGTFGQGNISTTRIYAGKSIGSFGQEPFGQMGFAWLASRVANNARRMETKSAFASTAFSGEKTAKEVVIAKGGVSTVINLTGDGSIENIAGDTQWLLDTQAYFETCSTTIEALVSEMSELRERIIVTLNEMRTLEDNYKDGIPYQGDDNSLAYDNQVFNLPVGYANARRVYWNARIPTIDPRTNSENEENLVPLCEELREDYLTIAENCGFIYSEGTCDESELEILPFLIPNLDYPIQTCMQDCPTQTGNFKPFKCLEHCKTSLQDLAEEEYMKPHFQTEAALLQKLDEFFGKYNQTSVWPGGGDTFGDWGQ